MPQLAKRFRIKPIPEVENLCRISKDLYNQSLYELRKKGEEEGVWLSHFDLRDHMKTVHPGEGIIGYMNIKRKRGQMMTVNIPVGDSVYSFDWDVAKRKK